MSLFTRSDTSENSLIPQKYLPLVLLVLFLLMAGGAWARWQHIRAGVFQIDEFISMLAIRMILEKGYPLFPSGLFYDHGLFYSYVGAAVAGLSGQDALAARWWSLTVGVLNIGLIYVVCWRLFNSHGWGLVAAMGLAGYGEAIQWGGRVRMYSQANMLLLSWVLLAWLGTFGGGHRWARWGFILCLWLGAYTHQALLLAFPPLVVALGVVWIISNWGRLSFPRPSLAISLEIIAAVLVIVAIGFSSNGSFQANYRLESATPDLTAEADNTTSLSDILHPTFNPTRWTEMGDYLTGKNLLPFFLLGLVAVARTFIALIRKRFTWPDLAALFVALMLGGIIAGMLLFISDKWQVPRYNYLIIFPLVLLLSAYGLQTVAGLAVRLSQRLFPNWSWGGIFSAGVVLLALGLFWPLSQLWPDAAAAMAGNSDTPNRLNLAFELVDSLRNPEDRLMTTQPAAGYFFSTSLNYYTNQDLPLILPNPQGGWIDGYAGSTYIENVAELNQAINEPGHLWFVSDEEHLYKNLEPIFAQNLLNQMELVQMVGNILVLREHDNVDLPPEKPTHPLDITLAGNLKLVGYSLREPLLPGQENPLVLYLENARPVWLYKVFVHLRDAAGNTVAQADFSPLDQIDEKLRLRMVGQAGSDMVHLTTNLIPPQDLPAGQYSLVIGLYDPTTQQRFPISNDPTGENALILGQVEVR